MKIGFMNAPAKSLKDEIQFASDHAFDFLDLTLEPPKALITEEEVPEIRRMLADANLGIVGHTAYYLQIDSPFPQIRKCTIELIRSQMTMFALLGAEKITIHFMFSYPHRFFEYQQKRALWFDSARELVSAAQDLNVKLMLENTLNHPEFSRMFYDILKNFPEIGFHLDVGHANLNTQFNRTPELLKKFARKLSHVHLSDNMGGSEDLHLPLGAGKIPWKMALSEIHRAKYNDTFTLEVFSPEREYLLVSREKLRFIWSEIMGGVK